MLINFILFSEGLDFYYHTEAHARKMVDFLNTVLPCRYQHSKKLISHDIHSNTYNYKFSYSVEIVPLSKDSLVCLPKNLTHQLGGINPLVLVFRVTNTIHFIDPSSAQSKCWYWGCQNLVWSGRIQNALQEFFFPNLIYLLLFPPVAEMNANTFWRYPFKTVCNPKQLSEYIVMDIDVILAKDRKTFPGQGAISTKVLMSV